MTNTSNSSNTVKEEFSSLCCDSFKSHLTSYLINLCADLRAEKPSQSCFYVSDVENIYRLKAASTIPLQDDEDNFDSFYGNKNKSILSLRALHCLNYKFFNNGMRKILPYLVIDALGYDDNSLRTLLGDDDYSKVLAAMNEPTQEDKPAEKKGKNSFLKVAAIIVSAPLLIYFFYNLGAKISDHMIEQATKAFLTENAIKLYSNYNFGAKSNHYMTEQANKALVPDGAIKPEMFSTNEIINLAKEKNEQEKNKAYEKMMKDGGKVDCYKKTTYICDNEDLFLDQRFTDKKHINKMLQDANSVEKTHPKTPTGNNFN